MALEAWIRIGPMEPVMDDYQRVFDAWEAGGIRGLVFGRLSFLDEEGRPSIPAYPAKPSAYRDRGMEVEEVQVPRDAGREQQLHAMLDDAKGRGWTTLVFCPGQGAVRIKAEAKEADPHGANLTAAIWDETFSAFPQADGGIMDGWTEKPYELKVALNGLSDRFRDEADARGYDTARLDRGQRHLYDRFHSLTPAQVRYYGACGVLSEMNLFDINEDALYWLRWQRQDSIETGRAVRGALDELPRKLLLGNGPRSAMFAGMTGLDFLAWDEIVDLLLVKHFFWHRGFDGMYGTVARWVQQIHEWNPSLSEADCFTVTKAWLGVNLPEVTSLPDLDLGFPQAFFDQVVQEETKRALAAVSDPNKILPWVDTARMPHRGDQMTSGDLQRILEASEEAGLKRFLYHNHTHLTAAGWAVISRMCGTPWSEDPEGYWPPDTPKPKF